MSESFEAIYDNGVLRPLEPLALPDQARLRFTISEQPVDDADTIAKQKAALRELFRQIDADPQAKETDWHS